MPLKNKAKILLLALTAITLSAASTFAQNIAQNTIEDDTPQMIDYPVVRLQSLEKTTARTSTFEATVGRTIKFGSLFIKVQACRKAPPIEKPESAAFLQIWENKPDPMTKEEKPEWIFSGWMFASSPGLSSMDHMTYDVWVLDCMDKKSDTSADETQEKQQRGEGELKEEAVPAQPDVDVDKN